MRTLTQFGMDRPKMALRAIAIVSSLFLIGVGLPAMWPDTFSFLQPLKIDTDPENMLPVDEPVRVTHNALKAEYGLYDMVVVGVVNKTSPNGVFNVETLTDVHDLTQFSKTLKWQDQDGAQHGVIEHEVMSPATVDNISQAGLGAVSFSWLMSSPPQTEEDAQAIGEAIKRLPMFDGTLASEDGSAIALYVPIHSKNDSYEVATKLKERIATYNTSDEFHITGLPVAQDQFGVEMFVQMAISAPAAMILIFLLMWFFFRQVSLIIAPMLVAMASVIGTMGLLIMTGNTVHIMSSMIPIFIMPIAVLDAVHILSDFFDRYQETGDRRKTLNAVMHELHSPMFFTSLTTFAGFGSLALTPIPPVQVFGIFVALGVLMAWALTITMVPAYIMRMKESAFENFGSAMADRESHGALARGLHRLGGFTYARSKLILIATLGIAVISVYGISRIQINDNPVKWFTSSHDIRVADRELNERFAGTYMAYLSFEPAAASDDLSLQARTLKAELENSNLQPLNEMAGEVDRHVSQSADWADLLTALKDAAEKGLDEADDDSWMDWEDAVLFFEARQQQADVFKNPELLGYLEELQSYLITTGLVGKSSSVVDVVKTVHRELLLGNEEAYRIPDTSSAVAQTLITFQNSHRPGDLWHFVTPDYRKSNLWIQLKSGDNRDMSALVDTVEQYIADNPAPIALDHQWFGLTYINVIWQQKMVSGMLTAFLGSFVVVLVLMAILFRSVLWGALAMVPLTVTIALIYGVIGIVGKDYDMPVAVLSSLSLGLAIDYAIHFLARSRYQRSFAADWKSTVPAVFGEPARAITRNVIVLGVGFLPLLAAPLVPYKTVGFFISAILLAAGVATLFILSALIRILEPWLFRKVGGSTVQVKETYS